MKPVSNRLFSCVKPMSDVKISNDGKYAAYLEHQASVENNNYTNVLKLCCLGTGETKVLYENCKVFAFRDSESIVLQGSGKKIIECVNISSGKMETVFENITVSKIYPYKSKIYAVSKVEVLPETDFLEFDTLPIWNDGAKFTDPSHNGLFMLNTATKQKTLLTCRRMRFSNFMAPKSGSKLLFTGAFLNEHGVPGIYNKLYIHDMITEKTEEITPFDEFFYKSAVVCGDTVVFFGTAKKIYGRTEHGKFFALNLKTKEVKCITPDWEDDITSGISSDLRRGGEHYPTMIWDGEFFYFTCLRKFAGNLYKSDLSGNVTQLTYIENGCVEGFDMACGKLVYTKIDGNIPSELYLSENGVDKRMTSFNTEVMSEYEVMPAEHVVLKRDGLPDIDGWVIKPYGYKEGEKYPAILNIHGGPMAAYGGNIYAEMQYMVARGYGVFFCNPRGSDGRGEEFGHLEKKFCDIDYTDIMDFTHMVVDNNEWIDKNNVFVTGGSYGGLMTNWIIGHTDFFRAAVTQRSISNYLTKILTTDIGFNTNLPQVCDDIWDDIDKVWDKSPLKYAKNVKTPTMIIHHLVDYRCWLAEGVQLYTALKLNGVDTKLVLYKGESHGLTTGGKPQSRIHKMEKIVEWFDTHRA